MGNDRTYDVVNVRVDGEIEDDRWKKLTDFIDEWKSSRKSSKKFYMQQIAKMAEKFKEQQTSELEEAAKGYRRVERTVSEIIE